MEQWLKRLDTYHFFFAQAYKKHITLPPDVSFVSNAILKQ